MHIEGRARKLSGALVLAFAAAACGPTRPPTGTGGTGGSGGSAGSAGVDAGTPQCFGIDLPPRALGVPKSTTTLAPYYPTTEFRTATPEAAGIDPQKLETALSFATAHSSTQGILVLRHGYIVAERYSGGFTATTRHESYSMAKSFSSALVGIAISAGLIPGGVEARLCSYYPSNWNCDDANDPRSRITLKHAMNIETGLQWHEDWRSTPEGTNDTIVGAANLLDYTLAKPAETEPGTVQRYSTGDPSLLSGVIQGATGKTALEYARQVLFQPIGIPDVQWNSDPKGRTTTYAGLQATLREYAKFAFLYSRHGMWDGQQIVPAAWVDQTTQAVDRCQDRYRYLWHINDPIRLGTADNSCADFPNCTPLTLANLPPDGYFAEGVFGQYILIFPNTDLVVVRLAQDAFGAEYWDEYARGFATALFDALTN